MRTAAMVLFGVLGSFSLLACGDAPLTVNGGEPLFDSGAMQMPPPSDGGGGTLPANCQAGGANAGSTFTDLYACYFGPMGVASCTHDSTCHVSGGVGGFIWLCGTDQATCLTGIKTQVDPTQPDPTQTALYSALFKGPNGTGINNMPATMGGGAPATYEFTDYDLGLITTWIKNGTPN